MDIKSNKIFENLSHPVCIIGNEGVVTYGNNAFKNLFPGDMRAIHLDWEHPLFPEYRQRLAKAYLTAINGSDAQCFAVIEKPGSGPRPVEIILFPMTDEGGGRSILGMMRLLDESLLAFDSSTLSYISEENFQYDNIHYEFSPHPILRVNKNLEFVKCSHSSESFLGFTCEELIKKNEIELPSLFPFDGDRIKNSISGVLEGIDSFHRLGEVKIRDKEGLEKITNITIYPIIQRNSIVAAELIIEDITRLKSLQSRINKMNRIKMLSDITKGFLHSLNNTVNVILSKTQLLLQVTEKDSVIEGIKVIEESSLATVEQIRRVQSFISDDSSLNNEKIELFTSIIEDSIEFAKIKFKVEDKEKRRFINIERKYFSTIYINANTRVLRELIILMILKTADYIQKKGTINISLKENNDLILSMDVEKSPDDSFQEVEAEDDISSGGIDIRRTSEVIKVKIIEEESADRYSLKAVIPNKMIAKRDRPEEMATEYRIRDMDILIVEDEKALKKILYDIFDRMGNRVFICENGKEALDEFKKNKYDIVITDYSTPGLTGIELSARVKEINENVITVLLTGWIIDNLQTYKNVLDIFHSKPFKIEDLIKSISTRMKNPPSGNSG